MTGNPIGDGYGGLIGDGYGGEILDGYPTVSTGPQPFVDRRARIIATHFRAPRFAGRAPAQVGIGPIPLPPSAPIPFSHRGQLQARAAHFARKPFPGRVRRADSRFYGGGVGIPPRASQIFAEVLSGIHGAVRASQLILEAVALSPAGARASQLVTEALYQQANPTYVRASQLVVEVLVPYTELPVIPYYPVLQALTWDYVKRPKESVGRAVGSSGREIAVNYWAYPQWEWDLTYDVLGDTGQNVGPNTQSDIKTMIGFFLSQVGTFYPFWFQDVDDCQVTGQAIGEGDGVTKTFVFVRTYGLSTLGPFTGTEPIGGLDQRVTAPVIYIGGVPQTENYTLNVGVPYSQSVTFSTPPGAGVPITTDFAFVYFCRLKEDTLEYAKYSTGLWELKKCTIYSLKN